MKTEVEQGEGILNIVACYYWSETKKQKQDSQIRSGSDGNWKRSGKRTLLKTLDIMEISKDTERIKM